MKRKVMLQLVVPLLSLCVLFLLLAYSLEPKQLQGPAPGGGVRGAAPGGLSPTLWSTARQGMEQAAITWAPSCAF
ncbi:MAG: hypothetical protein V8R55_04300 [Dysosmobacter sp.]